MTHVQYESGSDVVMLEVSDKPITHAKEAGNMVVHFTEDDTPVLIEILEASTFLSQANMVRKHAVAA